VTTTALLGPNGCFRPILLKNSFFGGREKFSAYVTGFVNFNTKGIYKISKLSAQTISSPPGQVLSSFFGENQIQRKFGLINFSSFSTE